MYANNHHRKNGIICAMEKQRIAHEIESQERKKKNHIICRVSIWHCQITSANNYNKKNNFPSFFVWNFVYRLCTNAIKQFHGIPHYRNAVNNIVKYEYSKRQFE